MKKSIIKDITILIVGMMIVGVPVMAVSYIPSKDITYKTDYNENVTNVEEALDVLTNQVKEINNTGDSISSDILSGKTAYVNGKLLTGSMANYSGANTPASNIRENGSNAEISIPDGYYDTNSRISVPLNTIEQLPTISSDLSSNGLMLKIGSYSINYTKCNWSGTIDISKIYADYKKLNINNFTQMMHHVTAMGNVEKYGQNKTTRGVALSYNQSTGILTWSSGCINYNIQDTDHGIESLSGSIFLIYP